MVNAEIREPKPSGRWVDAERCHGCGAWYRDHRGSGYDWADASELVRSANGGWDSGGGYRSRGAVLWARRVLKLQNWYMLHAQCGECWPLDLVLDDDEGPDPEWLDCMGLDDDGNWIDLDDDDDPEDLDDLDEWDDPAFPF